MVPDLLLLLRVEHFGSSGLADLVKISRFEFGAGRFTDFRMAAAPKAVYSIR
jgi:hypothetical protein